jgi:hypothetical protein
VAFPNCVTSDHIKWCSTCLISNGWGSAWQAPDRTDRTRSIEHVESTQPRLEPDPGAWAWALAVAHITTASSARLQPSRRRLGMFRRVDLARDHSSGVSVLFAGILADTLACLLPTCLVGRLADVRSRPIAAALVDGTGRRDGSTRFALAPARLERIDGRELEQLDLIRPQRSELCERWSHNDRLGVRGRGAPCGDAREVARRRGFWTIMEPKRFGRRGLI